MVDPDIQQDSQAPQDLEAQLNQLDSHLAPSCVNT